MRLNVLNRLENGFNNFILTRLCRCSKFTSIGAWTLDKNGSLCCRIHCIHFHYWDAQLIPDDCFRECGNNNGEDYEQKNIPSKWYLKHWNSNYALNGSLRIRPIHWNCSSNECEKNRLIFTIPPPLLNLSVMLMCYVYPFRFNVFFLLWLLFSNFRQWLIPQSGGCTQRIQLKWEHIDWKVRSPKKNNNEPKKNKEPIEMLSIQSISWMLVFLLSLSLAP